MDIDNIDIEKLVEDHDAFNEFVYTPLDEALKEFERRKTNSDLDIYIEKNLGDSIPGILKHGKIKAIMFRQIATPNYEIRRFLQIIDSIDDLDPLFGEYRDDTFYSINDYKKSWGKIKYHGKDTGHSKIIDFKEADGKKISDLKTTNHKNLIDFHHSLFEKTPFKIEKDYFFDISEWIYKHGQTAKNYYRPVLMWFLKDAILFENFVLNDEKEKNFTKNIFLPEFIKIWNETGYKPIIVDLLPTKIEHKDFWMCHPPDSKKHIDSAIIDKQTC